MFQHDTAAAQFSGHDKMSATRAYSGFISCHESAVNQPVRANGERSSPPPTSSTTTTAAHARRARAHTQTNHGSPGRGHPAAAVRMLRSLCGHGPDAAHHGHRVHKRRRRDGECRPLHDIARPDDARRRRHCHLRKLEEDLVDPLHHRAR